MSIRRETAWKREIVFERRFVRWFGGWIFDECEGLFDARSWEGPRGCRPQGCGSEGHLLDLLVGEPPMLRRSEGRHPLELCRGDPGGEFDLEE